MLAKIIENLDLVHPNAYIYIFKCVWVCLYGRLHKVNFVYNFICIQEGERRAARQARDTHSVRPRLIACLAIYLSALPGPPPFAGPPWLSHPTMPHHESGRKIAAKVIEWILCIDIRPHSVGHVPSSLFTCTAKYCGRSAREMDAKEKKGRPLMERKRGREDVRTCCDNDMSNWPSYALFP